MSKLTRADVLERLESKDARAVERDLVAELGADLPDDRELLVRVLDEATGAAKLIERPVGGDSLARRWWEVDPGPVAVRPIS